MKKKLLFMLVIAICPVVAFADKVNLYSTVKGLSTGYTKDDAAFSGNGVTISTEKDKTVYIYTGSSGSLNNFAVIDNMCFTILRTTYQEGVKLAYYGPYENGTCTFERQSSTYNTASSISHSHVGFMYGEYSEDSIVTTHSNDNSSNIKTKLETFYTNKLADYDEWLSDDIYCNDRDKNSYYGDYNQYGYNYGYYKYYYSESGEISLSCRKQDSFTKDNRDGNRELTKMIGTISYPEYMLSVYSISGSSSSTNESGNWMYDLYGKAWTMSASHSTYDEAYVRNTYPNDYSSVDSNNTLIPVISVNKKVYVKEGNGSITMPYVLYYDDGLVHGKIIWEDDNDSEGLRPDEVTITVYADDEVIDEVIVKASDDWKFSLRVDEYNTLGNVISYKVNQNVVDGYELTISGTQVEGFTLVNTHVAEVKGEEEPTEDEPVVNPPTGKKSMLVVSILIVVGMICAYVVVRKNDLFKSNY